MARRKAKYNTQGFFMSQNSKEQYEKSCGKNRYSIESQAWAVAEHQMKENNNLSLSVYKCFCGGWHLTSKKQAEKYSQATHKIYSKKKNKRNGC